jgi:hypothetical protein
MSGPEPGLEIRPGLTLLRRLGRGGMGEAWLARDRERGRDVVAKLLPLDSPPERLALLRREARLVRKLEHSRIVPVYGFEAGERFAAVTARHMTGGDAATRRGDSPLAVARLGRDVADALAYLHEVGVVHRDVKPSNVLLDEAGRAHLADFGIAAVAQGDEEGIVVRGGGSRVGMSPQQRAGEPAHPSDDLYALGVLLLDLLSGRPPEAAHEADAARVARSLLAARPVPARLAGLVASLLAATAAERPRSAVEVRDELDAVVEELERASAAAAAKAVRLSPPPRAGGQDLAPWAQEPLPGTVRGAGRRGPATGPLVVVGGLLLLAVVAIVWLPRLAVPAARPEAAGAASPATVPDRLVPAATAPTSTAAAEAARATARPRVAEAPAEVIRPTAPERTTPPAPAAARSAPAAVASTQGSSAVPAPPAPAPAPTPDRLAEARELAAHRERGALLEAREDWRGVRQEYEQALAIDPHVTFALEGRERAMKRQALDEALDFHLGRPDRLSADAVSREAEALLERARGAHPAGPALQARIQALEAALSRARTKVAVVIESDGLTELTLSRVGSLGTLTQKRLELLPGRYTVTGSRRGYRDVRRQFEVAPGAPGPTVALRCEETVR